MFMVRTLMAALAVLASSAQLHAQDWDQLAYYVAQIGPEDMRNSSGTPIRTLGGVLQQDRANYHRFGIRHARDSGDPIFASRSLRAQIPAMVEAGNNGRGWSRDITAVRPFTVSVFVCGYGGVPSVIYLAGAGEDHSGCY